ncbi:MAG: DUF4405 domain-containing protein [Lachnospiraceae bacterium]|nr:DUF4405 domain-containing protein [Lachnospiraceae bacterium]
MKPKMIIKISVDIGMTLLLLLLMAYEMVGQALHEWLGVGMFVLFVLHHILNGRWSKSVLKGRYTAFRIWQTLLVCAVLLTMLGSMISGVILSRHAFSFLPARGGRSIARTLHMVCAYWGFVFLSLHIGLHWSMMVGMVKRLAGSPHGIRKWLPRIAAVMIAGYGVYAFWKRNIGSYMFLKIQFAFFDFGEPLMLFLLDYIAVMGLFICIGHYFSEALKKRKGKTA